MGADKKANQIKYLCLANRFDGKNAHYSSSPLCFNFALRFGNISIAGELSQVCRLDNFRT
jgi:hypothetical protein